MYVGMLWIVEPEVPVQAGKPKGYRDCPCLLLQADPLYLCGSRVDIDYSRAQKEQWRDRHHESRDWVCFKVLRPCTICKFKFYVFVFHAV